MPPPPALAWFRAVEANGVRIPRIACARIAWDSAGVTTGPVTVPLVLAMGLGLGNAVSAVEGFGILSLASICPIVAVLTMGLVIQFLNKSKSVDA